MIARLISPIPAAAFALVLALLLGPAWFYIKADKLFAQALAARRSLTAAKAQVQVERRAQGWNFWTIEIENLSAELKEEKKKLQERSDQLDQRAGRMAADRQELDRIRLDLENLRKQIDLRVVSIKADEAKNLRGLASTYATLPPKSAVAILREMDDVTVVKILSLMKSDMVGPLFDEMSRTPLPDGSTLAKRAAVISEKIRMMKAGIVPAGS